MTPSQLAAYLASIVAHDLRLSLMIWGAPGIAGIGGRAAPVW